MISFNNNNISTSATLHLDMNSTIIQQHNIPIQQLSKTHKYPFSPNQQQQLISQQQL